MPDYVQSMMYLLKDGVPWHGHGIAVDQPLTAAETIVQAGLDWTVSKEQAYHNAQPVPGEYFTVRDDTSEVLGVVGRQYKVIQNKDLFRFLDPVIGPAGAFYHTAGATRGGRRVWIMAKLPMDFWVADDDRIEMHILAATSHDSSLPCILGLTTVRVVCDNTLSIGTEEIMRADKPYVAIRHTPGFEYEMRVAHKMIGLATRNGELLAELFGNFARVPMDSKSWDRYMKHLFPSRPELEGEGPSSRAMQVRDAVLESFYRDINNPPGFEHSTWSALNAVTSYVDHEIKSKDRVDSMFFGRGQTIKAKAFRWLAKYMLGVKI